MSPLSSGYFQPGNPSAHGAPIQIQYLPFAPS
jgi:hypothetical protein